MKYFIAYRKGNVVLNGRMIEWWMVKTNTIQRYEVDNIKFFEKKVDYTNTLGGKL